jgi:hypothetical protein
MQEPIRLCAIVEGGMLREVRSDRDANIILDLIDFDDLREVMTREERDDAYDDACELYPFECEWTDAQALKMRP